MKICLTKTVFLLVFGFYCSHLLSQVPNKTYTRAIEEADVFYYYNQDYEKAAIKYESLLSSNPENANLKAKLGICYLNIDGRNADALKMLTMASKNIVTDEKEYRAYGMKAPVETILYLAIAYHHNDSIEKAITVYTEAKKILSGNPVFTEEYIDNQIRDCKYALEMKKKPLTLVTNIFTTWLVDYPGACNPVLSKNDSVFVFTQKINGKTKILCSYKSGTWKKPIDITNQLGGFDRFYSNSITGNGEILILYLDDGGDGNLYYSERTGASWSKIKNIGRPINNIYLQAHGFITPDGKTMYFSSNRPGGEGELDIWYSEKDASGKWGEPINCGNTINTPYNEDTPFFDQQSNALIYSSNGHTSMGGTDVFRSVKKNGVWTTPVGMPYPFNTSQANDFFILNNNKPGFITSLYNDSTKTRNIFEIVAEDPAGKITSGKGTVTLKDGLAISPALTSIRMVDLKKPSSPVIIKMADSTSFKFEIKPGDYQIFVSYKGYKTDTINLSLPLYFSGSYVSVSSSLVPDKVAEGQFLSIKNVLFELNSYDLDNQAKSELEKLTSILLNYPELNVVVSGYTDALGSKEYNNVLADKRATSVINYLVTKGTLRDRFVKKAYGKSDFVAKNTNPDGSDNSEGRKYNRRVTFGIINPKSGVVIHQESFTPEHLQNPASMKYSIVLLKSNNVVSGYFSALTADDKLFFKTFKTDSASVYTVGVFNNKADAAKYLKYVNGKGFNRAYIVDQYELMASENESDGSVSNSAVSKIYTIQLKATLNRLDMNKVFPDIEGVKEFKSADGFYKYYYGEYSSKAEAIKMVSEIRKKWFEDAFIQDLYLLKSR